MKLNAKKYIPELVFIALLFIVYYIWASLVAFANAPDEQLKWSLIDYISKTGIYPPGYEPAILDATYGNSYAFEPALMYLIEGGFVSIARAMGTAAESLYMAARLLSVIVSCGAVFVFFRIGELLFKKPWGKWLFVFLVALLPQYAFLSCYINNDIFGIFCGALIILAWIRGLRSHWAACDCILLGAGVGLCLLSYYYAYPIILMSVVLFIASNVYFIKKQGLRSSAFAKKAIIALIIAFLIAGWYFIRNIVLYDGDIFAMKASAECAELNAAPDMKPSLRATPQNLGMSLPQMLIGEGWLFNTARSFFAGFGNLNIFVNIYIYLVYGVIMLAGAALAISRKRVKASSFENRLLWVCMILSAVIILAQSVYYSYYSDLQPQGRYLLQGIVPIFAVVTLGFENLALKFKRWKFVVFTLMVLWAALFAVCSFYVV